MAVAACDTQKAEKQQGAGAPAAEAEAGLRKGIDRSHKGKPLPEAELFDADNDPSSLGQLKGQPVLVNLWASWCVPCVKELPTLQQLGRAKGLDVVAVSQDMAPRSSVDAFLVKHKLGELEVWHDPKMALSGALGVQVLPTTILYGADGKEVWRYTGDLDWTGVEAAKLLSEAGPSRGG
ncbi:MAG: TlpA disulfide reductase family protein [Sphingomicrobium sp.]